MCIACFFLDVSDVKDVQFDPSLSAHQLGSDPSGVEDLQFDPSLSAHQLGSDNSTSQKKEQQSESSQESNCGKNDE